jgi:DNA-binding LytR/AlgR family response regulator
MLSYIIADDDELYRDTIFHYLNQIQEIKCLAICQNALELREHLNHAKADFLILDIDMPLLSGIDLVKSLKDKPLVIFITSHHSYAVEAFEIDAVDYITKPFNFQRLLRAIDKVKFLKNLTEINDGNANFKSNDEETFFIKEKNLYFKIKYSEVDYLQSLGDFTYLFLENGEKKIVLANLKSIENQLPKELFLRISRTNMVNIKKITALDSEIVILNKIQLSIGKTYADNVANLVIGKRLIKRFIQ